MGILQRNLKRTTDTHCTSSRISEIGGDVLPLKELSRVKWIRLLVSLVKYIFCGLSPFYKIGAMSESTVTLSNLPKSTVTFSNNHQFSP